MKKDNSNNTVYSALTFDTSYRARINTDNTLLIIMLYASPNLSTSYSLKEEMYRVLDEKDTDKQRRFFNG